MGERGTIPTVEKGGGSVVGQGGEERRAKGRGIPFLERKRGEYAYEG